MPSVILDAFARPAQYTGGGSGVLYARTQDDARLRPPPLWHFDDYLSLLGTGRWKSLVSESRAISSRGLLAAALLQKIDYVSGSDWRPCFTGDDMDYGEAVESLLEDTAELVCTRGPRYNWRTLWRLVVLAQASDGGVFLLLTKNADGWPLVQPLEAHRIGQRSAGSQIVQSGEAFTRIRKPAAGAAEFDLIETPYTGLRIINGVIYNTAGCEVAYRVLGPTPAEDEDISARDLIHIGAPRWFSEGRPVPQVAAGLMELLGVDLARAAQLDQQIIDSKLTLVEHNETGRRDPVKDLVNPPFTQPSATNTAPELIERGGIRYVKNGGSLEPFSSTRPSDQWMNFDLRTAATAIAAIGWRLEMLDPSALRGAATRAFQDQINTSMMSTFKDVAPAARRVVRYLVSCHAQLGTLPDHAEFLKQAITPPPEFVVDRNSTRIDIEAVYSGADSMPALHRRNGTRSRRVLVEQAKYERLKEDIAKKYRVDPKLLGQAPTTVAQQQPQAPAAPDDQPSAISDQSGENPKSEIRNPKS